METQIQIIAAILGLSQISLIFLYLSLKTNIKKTQLLKTKIKDVNVVNIQDSQATMDFFNQLLDTKFKYYLNSFMIAYFVSNQELEKKVIKKLKNDFYVDISTTLNDDQKNHLLTIFSKRGIELYIHQTFLRLLNDANIKFQVSGEGLDGVNKQMLDAIYKDN